MALVCTNGPMENDMKDFGLTDSNTVKASSPIKKVSLALVYGKKAPGLSGCPLQ
jgi:hypothetical protein